ncbi:MAG: hypothetical protein HQL18_00240 [Candidatus Omnitrophica bacterium]|nr:hypothetical protein [Candidatus Omnitrophota bacterium]
MKKILLAATLALVSSGCCSLSPLPSNDASHLTPRIETALAGKGSIKEMVVLNLGNARTLIIKLNLDPAIEEEYALNAMRALERDPAIPMVDDVSVVVEQTKKVALSRQMLSGAAQGFVQGLAGVSGPVSTDSTDDVTTFSCYSTREDLLNGKEPIVKVRHAVYVSGRYEGQSTDSLWLTEKKENKDNKTPGAKE